MSVAVASLAEIAQALADAITDGVAAAELGGEALRVWPFLVLNPSPPTVDIYPADPFSEQLAFGPTRERDAWFMLRARVSPGDVDSSQALLLALMDSRSSTSVAAAVYADRTLGGRVNDLQVAGPSGIIVYTPLGNEGYLVGCEWRTRLLL